MYSNYNNIFLINYIFNDSFCVVKQDQTNIPAMSTANPDVEKPNECYMYTENVKVVNIFKIA